MIDWITALAECRSSGEAAVLVTVMVADGSTPREAGAKMVVGADESHGTIGGGHLELEAIATSREMLSHAAEGKTVPPLVREIALGPSLGQCCGGKVTLFFEAVLPPPWKVAIFGAGHVGRALVKLFADLPCQLEWIDSREAEFPCEIPANVHRVETDEPEAEVADLPSGCQVLVMTHSHALDQSIVEAALRRGDFPYVGVIGSRTKRARFEARLRERGFSAADLKRMTCPVGVPEVGGKLPTEIAIAVVAQLMQKRRNALPRDQ